MRAPRERPTRARVLLFLFFLGASQRGISTAIYAAALSRGARGIKSAEAEAQRIIEQGVPEALRGSALYEFLFEGVAWFEDHLYTSYSGDLEELYLLAWRTIIKVTNGMPSASFSQFPVIIAREAARGCNDYPGPCSYAELTKQLRWVLDTFTVLGEDVDAALEVRASPFEDLHSAPDAMEALLNAHKLAFEQAEWNFAAGGMRCTWTVACVQLGLLHAENEFAMAVEDFSGKRICQTHV